LYGPVLEIRDRRQDARANDQGSDHHSVQGVGGEHGSDRDALGVDPVRSAADARQEGDPEADHGKDRGGGEGHSPTRHRQGRPAGERDRDKGRTRKVGQARVLRVKEPVAGANEFADEELRDGRQRKPGREHRPASHGEAELWCKPRSDRHRCPGDERPPDDRVGCVPDAPTEGADVYLNAERWKDRLGEPGTHKERSHSAQDVEDETAERPVGDAMASLPSSRQRHLHRKSPTLDPS
jgi:hypothetical protein